MFAGYFIPRWHFAAIADLAHALALRAFANSFVVIDGYVAPVAIWAKLVTRWFTWFAHRRISTQAEGGRPGETAPPRRSRPALEARAMNFRSSTVPGRINLIKDQ